MAAYISVPRDLTKVKSKVAFNLTKRQLLCFGTAALIGVPLFFVLRDSGGMSKPVSSADAGAVHHGPARMWVAGVAFSGAVPRISVVMD